MFKKINLALVCFFSILTINYNLGYALTLPIFIFYLLKDNKNIYYLLPTSFLAIIIFSKYYILSYLVLSLCLIIFIILIYILANKPVQNISNNLLRIIICAYLVLINIIMFLLFFKIKIISIIILTLISLIIYIFLEYNLVNLIKSQTKEKNNDTIIYLELIVYTISVIGSSTISIEELNLGIFVSMFFTMLLSKKYKNIYSFIYSITLTLGFIFLKDEYISLLIPVIGAFYLLPKLYAFFILNCFLTILLVKDTNQINTTYYLYFMFSSVIFELLGPLVFYEKKTEMEEYEYIYRDIFNNVSKEILGFSDFLNSFVEIFKTPSDYNEVISNEIKIKVQNVCNNCYKKKECFNKYGEKLYPIFKESMTSNIKNQEFLRYCPNYKLLENNKKINFANVTESKNNGLILQIYTIAEAVKKYILSMANKEEIKYPIFVDIKTNLIDYAVDIKEFKVIKPFKNDFKVLITLNNNHYEEKEIITIIKTFFENILKEQVTVKKKQLEDIDTFIVTPKLKIDIIYGYGTLSEEKISGDNYLIKELDNGRLLAAISDGMGKGYSAFKTSNATIELVNKITNLDIDITTALSILNSFYTVQDYLERYATLDLVEINRLENKLTIYKMGGTTSYIIHENGKFEKILNKNLPFGIDEELNKKEIYLQNGDLIIMSSDGIFENYVNEDEIEKYLLSIKDLSPQKLVYEIINYTLKKEIKAKDDMSIIALKIINI